MYLTGGQTTQQGSRKQTEGHNKQLLGKWLAGYVMTGEIVHGMGNMSNYKLNDIVTVGAPPLTLEEF